MTSLLIPVEVENRAGDLPLPVVFVANHCSAIDPYLFGLIACENAFVTSWPFMIPIHSLLMRMAEYVDARGGWVEIESQGKALLDKGCSVTVWPEGHRSRDGKLRRFRKGAFKLAAAAHRPVVPVCIFGSGEILPPGHRLFRPGRIRIIVLPPVFPSQEDDLEVRVTGLKDEAHQRIADELKLRSGKS
ncbi:MAG: 1-acyl-sn-glycerol-3-phosphate acyltransferase [Desulfobulbaceae bacterium]|nr:1-acyl-sn-glycerol-3-phosphate acyltransferase [Desulfobulbaceae bacterium]